MRNNSPKTFFRANLDTYGGNSGSPVFNSDTHQIEGLLVRGETDFVMLGPPNNCNVSTVFPDTGGDGEDCTRTTQLHLNGYVLTAQGEVSMLRIHDVGTGYGPSYDHIDVEVVMRLDTEPDKAFGFQLRQDNREGSRRGMLDCLRNAYHSGAPVRIDYQWLGSGTRNGVILRSWMED